MSSPSVLRLHPDDDVAVAVRALTAGETVDGVTVTTDIPADHNIALKPVPVGGQVRKYGQVIGAATAAIAPGDWVHVQNLGIGDISARADTAITAGVVSVAITTARAAAWPPKARAWTFCAGPCRAMRAIPMSRAF